LITLSAAAREYSFCADWASSLVKDGVEDAAELGDEGKAAGRVPLAALLSVETLLCWPSPPAIPNCDQRRRKKYRVVRGEAPIRHLHAGRGAGLFRKGSNRLSHRCSVCMMADGVAARPVKPFPNKSQRRVSSKNCFCTSGSF